MENVIINVDLAVKVIY